MVVPLSGHKVYEFIFHFEESEVISEIGECDVQPDKVYVKLLKSSSEPYNIIFDINQGVLQPFPLEKLPQELQSRALSFCSIKDVLACSVTSTYFYQLVKRKNMIIWEAVVAKYFGTEHDTISSLFLNYKYGTDYHELFKEIHRLICNWPMSNKLLTRFWPKTTSQKLRCIRDIFSSFKIAEIKALNYNFSNESIGEEPKNRPRGIRINLWGMYDHIDLWYYTGLYSRYLIFGVLFLLFEQLDIQVKDGHLIVVKSESELESSDSDSFEEAFEDRSIRYIFNHFSSLCTLLTSSNVFGNASLELRKQLFVKLAGLGDIFYRGGFSTSTESLLCLVKVATLLDDTLYADRKHKEDLKSKAIKYLTTNTTDNPPDNPVTYYNLSCVYALFKDLDEAKKHFEWTFNYKDGEYKDHRRWRPNEINRLIQAASSDNDFDNIRHFPWFGETMKKAGKELESMEETFNLI